VRTSPLESARLTVRELAADDRAAVEEIIGADRERWLHWTALGYEQLAELRQPPYGERGVVLRESGRLVGLVGLVPALGPFGLLPSWPEPGPLYRPEVGLYWAVARPHRRHGVASEAAGLLIAHAFAELRLARVVATTERENRASIGVMRRLGMRVEENPEPEPEWFQVVGILDARPGKIPQSNQRGEGSTCHDPGISSL
jgi:RimJ/RimL family protein N-acetyltransferase